MFSLNLLKRTLLEQKIALAIYTIGLGLYAWMMVAMYPTISQNSSGLEQYWESFPETMKQFFGAKELSITTLEGFLSVEYILFWQIIILAFTIAFATRAIVKEIEDGTMELMLSYPISRLKFIFTKIVSGIIGIIILAGLSSLILYLTTLTIEDSIAFKKILYIGVASFGLFFAFLGINFIFSAIFSERSKANFTLVGILIASYLLNVFSGLSDKVEKFHFLSLFKYANTESILQDGTFELKSFFILIGVGVIGSIIAMTIFRKRDIQGK